VITRLLALARADRRLQVVLALALVGGIAFGWWTISPLFITTTSVETGSAVTGGRVIARGQLAVVDSVHKGSGPVEIAEVGGKKVVRFLDVAIQNGPDLHVYLGRGSGGAYDGARDLYIGALKATNGTFSYDLPASVNLGDYKSVIVWCRAFFTLFTYADLKGP